MINHQNNFGTNLTSGTTAGATTSPLNSIPAVDAPFYLAFDATNINGHYEVRECTSKTATNVNHAATTYNHTTSEEVRMVVPAVELDAISSAIASIPTTTADGWTPATGTWAYASATTITVPSGAAAIYSVGDKIKLTQTSVKYFYVTAVADTTLTVTGGTDYTVESATITSPCYSKASNPLLFPHWFAYTPTGPTNTTLTGRFAVDGRTVRCGIKGAVTGTPAFTNMPTLPITASANMPATNTNFAGCGTGGYLDGGTANRNNAITPDVWQSGTACILHVNEPAGDQGLVSATSPITWANTDAWYVWFTYEI